MRVKEENIARIFLFVWHVGEPALCLFLRGPLHSHLLLRTLTAAPPRTGIANDAVLCSKKRHVGKVRSGSL
jgi:hypothetical protein